MALKGCAARKLPLAGPGTTTTARQITKPPAQARKPSRASPTITLGAPDFFDAETNPEITFQSTSITAKDEDTYEIVGDLTMHGVTKPITLTAEVGQDADPWGNDRIGLEATGTINRSDWDIKFNIAMGSGNVVVSDKIKLELDIEAVKAV